jgi:hypothetical protein
MCRYTGDLPGLGGFIEACDESGVEPDHIVGGEVWVAVVHVGHAVRSCGCARGALGDQQSAEDGTDRQ